MKKDFKLQGLSSYRLSVEAGSLVYKIVKNWPTIDKHTLGTQIIKSFDSIAANIAEGFGRYHKKDKIKFFYNARASAFKSAHWLKTALDRKLVSEEEYEYILSLLQKLPKEINYLIKMTQNNLTK